MTLMDNIYLATLNPLPGFQEAGARSVAPAACAQPVPAPTWCWASGRRTHWTCPCSAFTTV